MSVFVRRRTALLLAAAAMLPLIVTAIAQTRFSRDLLEASADALLAARLDQIEDRMQLLHQRYRTKATWISTYPVLRATPFLRALVAADENIRCASMLDRAGKVIASSNPARVGTIGSTPVLASLIATGVAAPYVESAAVHYLSAIRTGDRVDGAVVLEVKLDKYAADLRDAAPSGVAAVLRDEQGTILARTPSDPRDSGSARVTATRPIRDIGWTVTGTAPIDQPPPRFHGSIRASLLACSAAVALAFLAQFFTIRRALRTIRDMTSAAATLGRGDSVAPVAVGGDGDLDALAKTFNQMSETISTSRLGLEDKVRERTQALEAVNAEMTRRNRELAERSEEIARHRYREQAKGRALAALTADAELDQVIGASLCELAAPVGAAVMLCYKLEGSELVPIASYAASEVARKSPVPLTGIQEQCVRKRRVEILDVIPDELDLRFDCLIAAGRPRAVILVPLSVGSRPSGLLVVGSLTPFSSDAVTMLSDIASPLALTIARRTLLDHTERIARELARRNEELAEQAAALEAQGEELKAQKQELSLKNEEVQQADRLKSEFLANMSHELRTPLNAVIGFSELLLEDGASLSDLRRQWVTDIHASGRHLLTLINRVLDLAKIESGHMIFSLEPVSAAEAVAAATRLVRPAAQKKDIAITAVAGPPASVQADRGRLQQVLINLLANAVKFSPEKSNVEVGFARQEGVVRFWVKDRGPGIDAETQKRLFQPFFQAESPLVKKHEGTGLGLAISRRLIEQHGGTMGVEGTPGTGSTFFFTVPAAREDQPAPAAPAVKVPTLAGRPSVLVVDDHDLNREMVRELLTRRHCRVLSARDGEEAISIAREHSPDLVLLDLAMPRKDGFAVAAELKRDPSTMHIPLVAVTALVMRGDDERCRAGGFDAYLPKPMDRGALDAVLTKFFGADPAARGAEA